MIESVLMIEDDEKIHELVAFHVTQLGFELDWARDGLSGLEKAQQQDYQLILLDLMLPQLGGMEVCHRLRESNNNVPIIMLTARGDELDRVLGLEKGADDYLTKPFSVPELMARIKAVLRRRGRESETSQSGQASLVKFAELTVDLERRQASLADKPVELSNLEYELLAFLVENAGKPFSRAQLLEAVWGYHSAAYETNVNTYINRLRKKLEDSPADPRFLLTVRGYGYRFADPEEQ